MNSRFSVIRSLASSLCSWGQRTTIPAANYVGGPVPFLRNPSTKFFKYLVILNFGFLIVVVLTFII